jgi:hypothetical protein
MMVQYESDRHRRPRTPEELLERRYAKEECERKERKRRARLLRIIVVLIALTLITVERLDPNLVVAGGALWAALPTAEE